MTRLIRNTICLMLIAFMVTLLHSCSTEYPELNYESDAEKINVIDGFSNVKISPILDYNSLIYTNKTRGSYAFDNVNYPFEEFQDHYMSSVFHVMAFRKTIVETDSVMAATADLNMLMNSPENVDRLHCLVSTDVTEPTELQSRGATTTPEDYSGLLDFRNSNGDIVNLYWNDKYGEIGYNFFAYYIDDAEVLNQVVNKDTIAIDVKIDGTQDIMVGAAPEVTEDFIRKNYEGITDENTINSIVKNGTGGYSTFGAIHGMQPNINVKHCLTRFLVRCNRSSEDTIKIVSMAVNAKDHGTIIVAANDKSLLGYTPTGDARKMFFNFDAPMEMPKDKQTVIGRGIMVPPAKEYSLSLVFTEVLKMTEEGDMEEKTYTMLLPLTSSDAEGFIAGKTYIADIQMRGAQKVTIDVVMPDHWKDGEDVSIGMADK